MNTFFLTTPIYYVNDKPHIGHAYTTIAADALARFHRLQGEEVRFVTGTDENSQKNVQAMEKAGESDLPAYLERMAATWKTTWAELGISLDDFIRTTEPRHLAGVERFWRAVEASGDLEKRTYTGLYCVGCEGFKVETDLVNDRCPLHPNKDLERLEEENWFFKLSNYRDALLAHLDAHPDFVQPEARRNEIRNYIKDFMADVSVSREVKKVSVGIPVPGDDSQRIYVWFDALLNYMTAVGYGTDDALFAKFWPANLHLVGKDIIKFHCALWPAMIMSAAKNDAALRNEDGSAKLPHAVFAHGFFTIDGQKISKSLGNAVDPRELAPAIGFDAIRYFVLREIAFGEDGDFSKERLMERYGADLANTLGNLVNRVVAMSRKSTGGFVPQPQTSPSTATDGTKWKGRLAVEELERVVKASYAMHRSDWALQWIWSGWLDQLKVTDLVTGMSEKSEDWGMHGLYQVNQYIEEKKIYKHEDKVEKDHMLYALLESIRWYAWMVTPVMPETARKIFAQLGIDADTEYAKGWEAALVWGGLKPGTALPEPMPLFPRIEAAGHLT